MRVLERKREQTALTKDESHPNRTHWNPLTALSAVPLYLLAITFLARSSQNMGQTTFPIFGRDLFDMRSSMIGIMVAVGGLAGVASSILIAAKVPTGRATQSISIGQWLSAISFVFVALPFSQWGLWAASIILGVGGGLVFPGMMTATGRVERSKRGKALAVYALILSASLAVGPLVEAAVLDLVGGSLRVAFAALLPIPVAAAVIASWSGLRQSGRRRSVSSQERVVGPETEFISTSTSELDINESRKREASTANMPTPTEMAETGGVIDLDKAVIPRSGVESFQGKRSFHLALVTSLTYQAPFIALISFGGLLARHVDGLSQANVQLAFGLFFAVSFGIRAVIAAISPIPSKAPFLAGAIAFTVAGIAVLGLGGGVGVLMIGMVLLGAPHGAFFPLSTAILAEGSKAGELARSNARLVASISATSVILPFICGWLVMSLGYRHMFLSLELPVVVFGLLVWSLYRRGASDGIGRLAVGKAA
ncbi:MAG: MFS transporter [Actinobacteria bacterium]|jgi:MFS family permease|nr:MFS transporter [Actinomycetota bacterium]